MEQCFQTRCKRAFPIDGAKLMMLESLVKMIVQSGVVHNQPDPKKWLEKGRIVGHRCGACHRASNAKVRKARMRKKKSVRILMSID